MYYYCSESSIFNPHYFPPIGGPQNDMSDMNDMISYMSDPNCQSKSHPKDAKFQ